jgi:hypothetical protein
MTHGPAPRTTLPPCPSWCTEDHHSAADPGVTAHPTNPADPASLGALPNEVGGVWRVCHRRQIGQGTISVLLYQVVDIGADGSIVEQLPPDVSWNHAESVTPAAAAQLATNLLAAASLLRPCRTPCRTGRGPRRR